MAVTITAGSSVTVEGRNARVAKCVLAGLMNVMLDNGRLTVESELALTPLLVEELRNFRVKLSPTGTDQFEAGREGKHDDLVLSVALGVWRGERIREAVDMRAFTGWMGR